MVQADFLSGLIDDTMCKDILSRGQAMVGPVIGFLSDAQLIKLIVDKIDSLYLAYCELDNADRAPAEKRNVQEVMAAFHKVQSLRTDLAHSIPPRLDELAIAHLRTSPGEWGARFIDEILTLTGNEQDRALARLQKRYNSLLPLKILLHNEENAKGKQRIDVFACPECHAALPEKYRNLQKVTCPTCGQAECNTGRFVTPVASADSNTQPEIIQVAAPYWIPIPPDAKERSLVADGTRIATGERHFMELAIEEARKSKPEVGRKNAPPSVGVVVVKDGEVLAKAHRGELGEGDHAEYTVLEKKLRDNIIAGTTVYTTLEPCTRRGKDKVPCAERLIERNVARVVIGILDPNPEIFATSYTRLRKAGIAVQLFDADLVLQIEEINREFIRSQTGGGKLTSQQKPGDILMVEQGSVISALNLTARQVAHSIINIGASEGRILPKLILTFDKQKDVEHQAYTKTLDPSVLSTWVRIRVNNPNGQKVAKRCRGYLKGIKWLGPGEAAEAELTNSSRLLEWEHHPGTFELDLHAGDDPRLDVVHAANNETCLKFSAKPLVVRNTPGRYEITIRVSAEDLNSELITLRIQWDGSWDTLRAVH